MRVGAAESHSKLRRAGASPRSGPGGAENPAAWHPPRYLPAALFKTAQALARQARRMDFWRSVQHTQHTPESQREIPMLTKIFLITATFFALLTLAFPGQAGIQLLAIAAVCLTAVLAAIQAGGEGRYLWVSGFIAMAVLVNPVVPVPLTRVPALAMLGICLAILASWLVVLRRTVPSQTIAQVLHPRESR
jgi:hypothetical protein